MSTTLIPLTPEAVGGFRDLSAAVQRAQRDLEMYVAGLLRQAGHTSGRVQGITAEGELIVSTEGVPPTPA
jgi:hypothetical protein